MTRQHLPPALYRLLLVVANKPYKLAGCFLICHALLALRMHHHLLNALDPQEEQRSGIPPPASARGQIQIDTITLFHEHYSDQYLYSVKTAQPSKTVSLGKTTIGDLLDDLWKVLIQLNETIPQGKTHQTIGIKVPNFVTPPNPSPEDDIVVASHVSVDKLDRLLYQAQVWTGPISASIFLNNPTEVELLKAFFKNQTVSNRQFLRRSTIHLYLEASATMPYPHNMLRNMALHNIAQNRMFLALDADFLPSKDSYRDLRQLLATNPEVPHLIKDEKTMMVLPAFDIKAEALEGKSLRDPLPNSKTELLHMYKTEKTATQFHEKFFCGHGPTNYPKWANYTNDGDKNTPDFYHILPNNGYEPYMIGYRNGIPKYYQEFRGFGRNKVSLTHELALAGYKFAVLTNFFVLHLEHPSTKDLEQEELNKKLWREKFAPYLIAKYRPETDLWTSKTFRQCPRP